MKSSIFICQNCEAQSLKWQGQCDECGEWNTLVEEMAPQAMGSKKGRTSKSNSGMGLSIDQRQKIMVSPDDDLLKAPKNRLSTQLVEFDRVLGAENEVGGIVLGSVILIGGEPGIGKSTLLTQVVLNICQQLGASARKTNTGKIFYICGEESPSQISLRIQKILNNEHVSLSKSDVKKSTQTKISPEVLNNLVFITSTDVDEVVSLVAKEKPVLLVVDSIQALSTQDLSGASGSVGQIRECSERITNVVKQLHIPTFLVGHVTKEGVIAGPKVLEHMVDAVLELSGERTGQLRLLRAIKNRFGATDEVGVFRMADVGMVEVNNPSEFFLEHAEKSVPGSATVCVMEGTRPLLLEVQSLVVKSQLAMPRRVGRGIELSRIQVLAAVLQKHAKLPLGSHDIFLSAAGGFKIHEPGIDLGLAMAIVSSLKNKSLPSNSVFIGEVGLLGEIRNVSYLEKRIREAKRLGFKHIYSRERFRSIEQLLKELKIK